MKSIILKKYIIFFTTFINSNQTNLKLCILYFITKKIQYHKLSHILSCGEKKIVGLCKITSHQSQFVMSECCDKSCKFVTKFVVLKKFILQFNHKGLIVNHKAMPFSKGKESSLSLGKFHSNQFCSINPFPIFQWYNINHYVWFIKYYKILQHFYNTFV